MITISQLTRLPQRFRRYYDRRFLPLLERTGLSMREVHVLLFLANHPGQDTARDVAELRGLADGEDRRIVHLDITEAGRPLAREAQAIQAACGRRLLAGLSEEEQAVFLDLLERVLRETEALT